MGSDYVYPSLDLGNYFLDYGDPYMDDTIPAKGNVTYIIPYMIDLKDINKSFSVSIYTGTAAKANNFLAKTIKVKLSPTKVWDSEIVRTANVSETISFSGSFLNDASINIKSVEFTGRYQYKYESCYNDECRTYTDLVVAENNSQSSQGLIVMDYDFILDNSANSYVNINSISAFSRNFMSVEYSVSDGMRKSNVSYVTPTRLKDKIILQTNGDVLSSDNVNLVITIRNRIYKIKLK